MNATLESRRLAAVEGTGNICVPSAKVSTSAFEPFDSSGYPYRNRIGQLSGDVWARVIGRDPRELVPLDPYQPSALRSNGTAVWDAAIGIPSAAIRPRTLMEIGRVAPRRAINQTWLGPTVQGMNRIGAALPGAAPKRPEGPYIYDMLYHPLGWQLMEGAHILVHRRQREIRRKQQDQHLPITARDLQRCTAELLTCLVYGLPVDVSNRLDERVGTPTLVQYGLDIRISSRFRCPTLTVPWNGEMAPIPDVTMGFISVGVFIEPLPRGVLIDNENWLECNRWTCLPTQFCIAGWEMVDVVSHYPIGSRNPDRPTEQRYYAVHPADLMPPDTLPDLLACAAQHRGPPRTDNVRYFLVEDWLASSDYQAGLMQTPPFPCESCLCYNQRTEGAPIKPHAIWRQPEYHSKQDKLDLVEWERARERIMRIATRATVFVESTLYGGRSHALVRRALRQRNYRAGLLYLQKVRRLNKLIDKCRAEGVPSRALELKRELDTLVTNHDKEQQKCSQLELTSELQGALPSSEITT